MLLNIIIITILRDLQSPFYLLEEKAIKEDHLRPAVKLANELKKNTFAHVLILDRGYKALIDELLTKKGTVDPFIKDFDPDKWSSFIETTGNNINSYYIYNHNHYSHGNRSDSIS